MKKIGFVAPWFSDDIKGGAEMELRGLVHHFKNEGIEIEVLTTCVKEFLSDWNKNFYKEGTTVENQITTRRFKVKSRNTEEFDRLNYKLMQNIKLTREEEAIYMDNMIHSPKLYEYIKFHQDDYALFVFIPYMFGTTYEGAKICPEKSIVIPCLHDESYAYLNIYAECFKDVRGMAFNAKPEALLAHKIYDLSKVKTKVFGIGLDTNISSCESDFCEKYGINSPFILYVGRKDTTKNVDTLIEYFNHYKKRNENGCKLIMIGPAKLPIPKEMENDIIDLGFVDLQDKYDAMAAASVLCQPSINESFSFVIMESWLCGTPVMVHDKCAVTKNFVIESNGGLYFDNYYEFEKELNFFLQNRNTAKKIAKQGKKYVIDNFEWSVIVDKYRKFFAECELN